MSKNKIVGDAYEKYVLNKYKIDYDYIWLWLDTPENILKKYNLIPVDCPFNQLDVGVDIVAIKGEHVDLFQCKNYSGSVSKEDIAGFLLFLITHNNGMHDIGGILCYSNSASKYVVNKLKTHNEKMVLKIELRHIPFDNNTISYPTPSIVEEKMKIIDDNIVKKKIILDNNSILGNNNSAMILRLNVIPNGKEDTILTKNHKEIKIDNAIIAHAKKQNAKINNNGTNFTILNIIVVSYEDALPDDTINYQPPLILNKGSLSINEYIDLINCGDGQKQKIENIQFTKK